MTTNQDEEHLKLLRIFHLIYGILHFPIALVPIIHISIGLTMVFSPDSMGGNSTNGPPPELFGWMFAIIGAFAMILIASVGVCNVIVAKSLKAYRRHTFCLVVSGINCLNAPLGTLLGVFTFLVLFRPSVKELFLGPPME